MITIEIPAGSKIKVDRDGTANEYEGQWRQGFNVYVDGEVCIHFHDERTAADMAEAILNRLGYLVGSS